MGWKTDMQKREQSDFCINTWDFIFVNPWWSTMKSNQMCTFSVTLWLCMFSQQVPSFESWNSNSPLLFSFKGCELSNTKLWQDHDERKQCGAMTPQNFSVQRKWCAFCWKSNIVMRLCSTTDKPPMILHKEPEQNHRDTSSSYTA